MHMEVLVQVALTVAQDMAVQVTEIHMATANMVILETLAVSVVLETLVVSDRVLIPISRNRILTMSLLQITSTTVIIRKLLTC